MGFRPKVRAYIKSWDASGLERGFRASRLQGLKVLGFQGLRIWGFRASGFCL